MFGVERHQRLVLDDEQADDPSLFPSEEHQAADHQSLRLRDITRAAAVGRKYFHLRAQCLYGDAMPNPPADPREGDRIAKLLARAGIASRREVERLIAEGRVARDGVVVDTPATLLTTLDGITVDGQPVAAPTAARLFLYHKPPGLLVTERDPAGRPTIYDRLPSGLPRLVPVGRLDLATEGLLLLTTDGGLKRQLELPATGVERAYRARAYGQIHQSQLEALIEGVEIDGIRYGSIDANIERRTGANVWIELVLTEGKNREVRRVLEHLELQVSRLIRTRYGPFVLGDLRPGEVGEVKQADLVAFRKSLDGAKRGRGATPDTLVAVEARAAPAPAPAPAAAPQRAPAPARPAAAPRSGWGQGQQRNVAQRQARPGADERPTRAEAGPASAKPRVQRSDASDRPARASFGDKPRQDRSASVDRPARSDAKPRAQRPEATDRPARTTFGGKLDATRQDRTRGDAGARKDAAPGGKRTSRSAAGRPGAAPSRPAPTRPGKGPAGGRGHPPRGGKR